MLILGASIPCVAFAALVGFVPNAAIFSSEVIFSLFAIAGLVLTGLNDYSRRPVPTHIVAM